MRTWTNVQDRIDATLLFVAALNNNPQLRMDCKNDSETARLTFRVIGDFDQIPADVKFTVLEENSPERDKIVIILLPELPLDDPNFIAADVLSCTTPPRHPKGPGI